MLFALPFILFFSGFSYSFQIPIGSSEILSFETSDVDYSSSSSIAVQICRRIHTSSEHCRDQQLSRLYPDRSAWIDQNHPLESCVEIGPLNAPTAIRFSRGAGGSGLKVDVFGFVMHDSRIRNLLSQNVASCARVEPGLRISFRDSESRLACKTAWMPLDGDAPTLPIYCTQLSDRTTQYPFVPSLEELGQFTTWRH